MTRRFLKAKRGVARVPSFHRGASSSPRIRKREIDVRASVPIYSCVQQKRSSNPSPFASSVREWIKTTYVTPRGLFHVFDCDEGVIRVDHENRSIYFGNWVHVFNYIMFDYDPYQFAADRSVASVSLKDMRTLLRNTTNLAYNQWVDFKSAVRAKISVKHDRNDGDVPPYYSLKIIDTLKMDVHPQYLGNFGELEDAIEEAIAYCRTAFIPQ